MHNDAGDTGPFAGLLNCFSFLARLPSRQSVRRSLAFIPRETGKLEVGRVDQEDMENYTAMAAVYFDTNRGRL